MKLISFSVENYRSITTARKIPLSDYSLLVGANNEGKSNILHALTLAMRALVAWQKTVTRTIDGRILRSESGSHGIMKRNRHSREGYEWKTDFPIGKQAKSTDKSTTNIVLEFALSDGEVDEFKAEIKSNINGTLPILFSFGISGFEIAIQKPGRGNATLNKKKNRITDFVSRRIRFDYIPAIRTANSAGKIISDMVERELRTLEDNVEYNAALAKIEELQKPIFNELAQTIQTTVSGFLPSVKSVRLDPLREARYRALRTEVEIMVNDGQETKLERKGDGVQSLVALALMRHASDQASGHLSNVIAIEEPESHLHPAAVHELKSVIEELSLQNQIVLSSHSPLFVNGSDLKNTVIVKGSQARCATHISQIRDALGVRFSDNLQNASLVLLVEGTDDAIALSEIIPIYSAKLGDALKAGTVVIDHLAGASALSQKASFYSASACLIQAFLDNDGAGILASEKAISAKSLKLADVNLCTVLHCDESEMEDLFDKSIYQQAFITEFGVDPKLNTPLKTNPKWSTLTEKQFRQSGKPWSGKIKAEVKLWLAKYASENAATIVNKKLDGPLVAFIASAEAKIPN
jgi:putative ATP-dependent endonuclease of OLD family